MEFNDFDPKSYLYGVYKNTFPKMSEDDYCYEYIERLLGNFKLIPGGINVLKDPNSFIKSISFIPVIWDNKRSVCNGFKLDMFGNYEVMSTTPYSKIRIYGNKRYRDNPSEKIMGIFVNSFDDKAGYYCIDDQLDKIYMVHYNMDTVTSLINERGMEIEDIIKLTYSEMQEMGYKKADEYLYNPVKSLDCTLEYYLLHYYHDNIGEFIDKYFDESDRYWKNK